MSHPCSVERTAGNGSVQQYVVYGTMHTIYTERHGEHVFGAPQDSSRAFCLSLKFYFSIHITIIRVEKGHGTCLTFLVGRDGCM